MSPRYYRPTLVFPPSAEKAISDSAHAAGQGVQEFMRAAVLRAIATPAPHAEQITSIDYEDLINSLRSLTRQLTTARRELDEAIKQIDLYGERYIDAPTEKASGEPAASDAIAAEQCRVVAGVLRSVAHLTGGAGEDNRSPARPPSSAKKAAGKARG